MHSRIFEISFSPVAPEDRIDEEAFYEDSCVLSHSDYVGDPMTGDDYEKDFDYFVKLFSPFIASFDKKSHGVTLVPVEKRVELVRQWFLEASDNIRDVALSASPDGVGLTHYRMKKAVEEYHGIGYLFYTDYGMTSGEFVTELTGFPDTIYIGGILDYHY